MPLVKQWQNKGKTLPCLLGNESWKEGHLNKKEDFSLFSEQMRPNVNSFLLQMNLFEKVCRLHIIIFFSVDRDEILKINWHKISFNVMKGHQIYVPNFQEILSLYCKMSPLPQYTFTFWSPLYGGIQMMNAFITL